MHQSEICFAQGCNSAGQTLQMYLYKYILGRFSEIIGEKGVNLDRYMRR